MDIYGIDFTSTPRRRKPITCARCELDHGCLRLVAIHEWASFEPFEAFLQEPGEWVCGMDFPFGQPCRLLENINWPTTWNQYVAHIGSLGKNGFESALASYRRSRPEGDKQHLRKVDKLAKSCSPMMLYGVPVGKMFFQGATRLLKSDVCIHPCRPTNDPRIVIEAYPALVARRWSEGKSYKCDTVRKRTPNQRMARQAIFDGLLSGEFEQFYGVRLNVGSEHPQSMVDDGTGDRLDAVLCAIQAGWAYLNTHRNYGIPSDVDADEGWIVDPMIFEKGTRTTFPCALL